MTDASGTVSSASPCTTRVLRWASVGTGATVNRLAAVPTSTVLSTRPVGQRAASAWLATKAPKEKPASKAHQQAPAAPQGLIGTLGAIEFRMGGAVVNQDFAAAGTRAAFKSAPVFFAFDLELVSRLHGIVRQVCVGRALHHPALDLPGVAVQSRHSPVVAARRADGQGEEQRKGNKELVHGRLP